MTGAETTADHAVAADLLTRFLRHFAAPGIARNARRSDPVAVPGASAAVEPTQHTDWARLSVLKMTDWDVRP
jgi:hypothetical protein